MISRRYFLKNTANMLVGVPFIHWSDENLLFSQNKFATNDDPFWMQIREAFPLSKNRAYFNNGTLGPSPQVVLDTVIDAMKKIESTGEMAHTIDAPRQRIAQFIKVLPSEIALTKNTTEGINMVAWGLPLKKGDEIIISNHEHVGNALPWLHVAKAKSLKIKILVLGNSDDETLSNLKKLVSKNTKVIAIPHITCTTGQMQPIKEIAHYAQQKGIFTAVDGAHGAGMLDLDLKTLGCDFYATCCHKWLLGPKGTGFLYVKKEIQDRLLPHFVGAGTHQGWTLSPEKIELLNTSPSAERYDYGTYNQALWIGVAAAIDFFEKIGMDKVEARIKELNQYLQSKLLELSKKDIKMFTYTEGVSPSGMLGFKLLNKDSRAFANEVNSRFRVRYVAEHGLNSLRISTHIYNNKNEIDDFILFLKNYTNH
jgi:cysteine desulfurase / selenocysteine lyase